MRQGVWGDFSASSLTSLESSARQSHGQTATKCCPPRLKHPHTYTRIHTQHSSAHTGLIPVALCLRLRQVGKPPFTKPVGAELGCVTPYIIVPGPWTDSDIDYHAENVATGLTQNAGVWADCMF